MTEHLERIELDRVLAALARRHGLDFTGYARASLQRRLRAVAARLGAGRLSDLVPLILHDQALPPELVSALSVPVSDLFRDPELFAGLGRLAFPALAVRPSPRIWVAGCAGGEEAFSLAILLAEAGMLGRTRLVASDLNAQALAQARIGQIAASRLERAEAAHGRAGGRGRLAEHFIIAGGQARLAPALLGHIEFVGHSLTEPPLAGPFDLICCRNVLIYFDRALQARVLAGFAQVLAPGGMLWVGAKENVAFAAGRRFAPLDLGLRLFARAGG